MNIETHARLLAAEVRRMHNLEREMLISKARITTLSAEITTMLDFKDRKLSREEQAEIEHDMPEGLCANRADHKPHAVGMGTLAPYWCTADQSRRQPYALQRRLEEARTDVLPAVREPGQDLRLIHSRPYVIPGGAASLAAGNRERGRGQTFAFNPIHKRLENETDTDVLPVVKMLCSLGRSDCPETGEHLHRPDGTVAYAAETP